jgi:23S rRNA (uracil1939-C5)-methyltransferase
MNVLTIDRLGQKGEGIAAGPIYVPYALAGEQVRAEVSGERGRLIEVIEASPDRIAPICPHYSICGGCAVQALRFETYQNWKRGLVVDALAHHHIAGEVRPLVDAHGAGRRRVTFHARIEHGKAQVGFMQARSHDIVAIEACPLLAPSLDGALNAARIIAQAVAHRNRPLDIVVTATETGLDIDLRGLGPLGFPDVQKLIKLTEQLDLARLSNHGAIVLERRAPLLQMGKAQVILPPGAFLQATVEAEEALARAVVEATSGAKRIADLFCGVGTFALRLAQSALVKAVESDELALKALANAARNPALQTVEVERRDLFARPLQQAELAGLDAVVFDPPRAGAQAQARELAKSAVPLVVAVSCNVQTFAQDAKILIEGGFALESVTPFDQFRFSPHVELVGVFRRAAVKAKRRLLR